MEALIAITAIRGSCFAIGKKLPFHEPGLENVIDWTLDTFAVAFMQTEFSGRLDRRRNNGRMYTGIEPAISKV